MKAAENLIRRLDCCWAADSEASLRHVCGSRVMGLRPRILNEWITLD